jgi:hypothetical protein
MNKGRVGEERRGEVRKQTDVPLHPLLSYSPPVHMYISNTFVLYPGTIPKV